MADLVYAVMILKTGLRTIENKGNKMKIFKRTTASMTLMSFAAVAMLGGCSDNPRGTTVEQCKNAGYKGIAIQMEYKKPIVRCSDGVLRDGKVRASGKLYSLDKLNDRHAKVYTYLPFYIQRQQVGYSGQSHTSQTAGNINIEVNLDEKQRLR